MLGGDAAPSLVVSQSVVTGRASRACDWSSLMASNSCSALSMLCRVVAVLATVCTNMSYISGSGLSQFSWLR